MNKIYRKLYSYVFLGTFFSLVSCSDHRDEAVCLEIQPHDENVFMQINHHMMEEMDMMQHTNDPDHDFAMMMSMHHQSAIDMSKEELKSGDNLQMKEMAQRVIDAQQAEKAMLQQYLQSHTPVAEPDGPTFNSESMMSMDKMMKAQDIRVLSEDSDVTYAQLLIDHHQSALEMAMAELAYGDDPMIREMASKMIEDQRKEIMELQDWLIKNKPF